MEIHTIITVALSVITLVAGGFWLKAKGKLAQIVTLVKESWDVLEHVRKALEDDKITKEEKEIIKKELDELKGAFKALIGK
jgi:hypothetical protein